MTQAYFYTLDGDAREMKHPIWAKSREDALAQAIAIAMDRKKSLRVFGPDGIREEVVFEGDKAHRQQELI